MFRYTTELIEALIPTLWSVEEKIKATPKGPRPDPEMPKGPAPDPSHAGDHMAHCADISRAWERADLTLKQKQVLLLRFGMHWTQQDVANHFDQAKQTVCENERRGIKNIQTFLNGTKREDDDDTNE